jgi:hypothetical protein
MKKIIIILAVFMLPLVVSAQKNFDKLIQAYQNDKGVSIVKLDKDLIDLYRRDNLSQEYLDVLKNIERVNILTSSRNSGYNKDIDAQMKQVNDCFNLDKYKLVKSRIDEHGFAKVYIKKYKDRISELLVINSAEQTTFSLIMLSGKFKLSNLDKLSYALNIEGLGSLNELNSTRNTSSHKSSFTSKSEQKRQMAELKSQSRKLKTRLKNLKRESHEYNTDDFEETMEDFGEAMAEWGVNFGENLEKAIECLTETISENVMIDDDSYNISFNGEKATIHISPEDNDICIIDGIKVPNDKIIELKEGEINRIRVIKRKEYDDNYLIITTHKKIGKISQTIDSQIKFKYKGETYHYDINDKNFPGFIINGKLRNSYEHNSNKQILQIRMISKIEKKAFGVKKDRIMIETK